MRTDLSATVISAFESGSSYLLTSKIIIEPTRMYFTSLDTSGSPGFAESLGMPDDPVLQTVGITSGSDPELVTFYNDGGTLKYQTSSGSDLISTAQAIAGQPGMRSGKLCWRDTSGNIKRANLDDTLLKSHNASPWDGSVVDTGIDNSYPNIACHYVDDDYIGLVFYNDGGIGFEVIDLTGPTLFTYGYRMMFPLQFQTSGSSRSADSLVSYSGASYDGSKIFFYVSNNITGGVDGIYFDTASQEFSDIFVAVPADLKSSICEFRVSNLFFLDPVHYMCGTFVRWENVDDPVIYTMILRSEDGHNWTMDRFSLVSSIGYRFFAAYCYDGDYSLWISSCNRFASESVTWLYDADVNSGGDAHIQLVIDKPDIIRYSDEMSSQIDVDLASSNKAMLYHAYITPGSRMMLYAIYRTSVGDEEVRYGTYFVDSVRRGLKDGNHQLMVSAKNMSQWQLAGMTAPFYTEIIAKSSGIDTLSSVDETILYTAEHSGLWEEGFSVDFWEAEGWEDLANDITPINCWKKGGIDRIHLGGDHTSGVRSKDLKDAINCYEYPVFVATSAVFDVYGWSYAESGSDNDEIRLHLWCEDENGDLFEHEETGGRWPCTYPSSAAGDYPISYTVSLPIGTRVREVGLLFVNSSGTYAYPCRVDVGAGISTYYGATDANTGWYSAVDKLWKVRGKGRPYIMFSRLPYDTFDFIVAASFSDTLSGYIATFGPVAYGLVGLAENGRNYIVGRYNKINDRLEIVKVRNGVETVLTYGTPTIQLTGGGGTLLFAHKGGKFSMRIYNPVNKEWVEQISYSWTDSDSWMFTNDVAAKHTGIYGYVNVPSFRISGFDEGSDPDEVDKGVGLAMMPSPNFLSYFPPSGLVEIGNSVYTYDGVIQIGNIRGPFQFRQRGHYVPPYGNGWGLQIRDHDWTSSASMAGYLLGVDDGFVYKITGAKWDNFNRTGGVRLDLPGRTTYYVNEEQVKICFHTLSNRCYVTGGLDNADLFTGEALSQPWGAMCYLKTSGDIQLNWFWGSSGDVDVTVEDLIEKISESAGARANFPGDITHASLTLTDGVAETIDNLHYTDGFDIRFTMASISQDEFVDVLAYGTILNDAPDPNDTSVRIRIENTGSDSMKISLISSPSEEVVECYEISGISTLVPAVRVLFHKSFITVYLHGMWVFTFHTTGITYSTTTIVRLYSTVSPSTVVTNVRLQEMGDWREAVYIDLETDGSAAVGSIIQERPVEIYTKYDGSISYWYDPLRSTITQQVLVREHTIENRMPPNAASDAIVYYSEVKTIQDASYRYHFGFSTKVYRFPSLETGAIRAAQITLERALSERERHSIVIRPNLKLEPGDKLSVSYLEGTDYSVSFIMIVDNIRLTHEAQNNYMIIDGRTA